MPRGTQGADGRPEPRPSPRSLARARRRRRGPQARGLAARTARPECEAELHLRLVRRSGGRRGQGRRSRLVVGTRPLRQVRGDGVARGEQGPERRVGERVEPRARVAIIVRHHARSESRREHVEALGVAPSAPQRTVEGHQPRLRQGRAVGIAGAFGGLREGEAEQRCAGRELIPGPGPVPQLTKREANGLERPSDGRFRLPMAGGELRRPRGKRRRAHARGRRRLLGGERSSRGGRGWCGRGRRRLAK